MALYDRNYRGQNAYYDEPAVARDESSLRAFIKQTYQLFAASMLAGTVGAYIGMGMAATIAQFYWGLVILEIVLIFGLNFAKNKPGLALGMLFGF